ATKALIKNYKSSSMINVQYAALDKNLNINFKKITMDSSQSQKSIFKCSANLQITISNIK
ncbi:MAG: hypothetical protein WAV89_05145, partial [Ignavibacteriaceae bacterium]